MISHCILNTHNLVEEGHRIVDLVDRIEVVDHTGAAAAAAHTVAAVPGAVDRTEVADRIVAGAADRTEVAVHIVAGVAVHTEVVGHTVVAAADSLAVHHHNYPNFRIVRWKLLKHPEQVVECS